MRAALRTIGISVALGLLGACSTIHKTFELDGSPPQSLSVDAKQRLILVTDRGGPEHNKHIACAEPSPDVMVAAAATGSITANIASQSGTGNAQYGETAASLSRSHTIQLLRDGLYRACEAYMNGALDEADYRALLSFYDVTMITTLTIESVIQPKLPDTTRVGGSTDGSGGAKTDGAGAGSSPSSSAPATEAAIAVQVDDMLKSYYDTKLKLYDKVHQATMEKLKLQQQMKAK